MKLILTFLFFIALGFQVVKAKAPPFPDTEPAPLPVPPVSIPLPPLVAESI